MSSPVENPILRGFNPDPSILRVDDDYYIATSTFEWFPGIRLHHSRDLVHWRVLGHALTDPTLLDLRGIPDSGGVWAPSLSYVDGEYWLAYSVVRTMDGDDKDLTNYLITASSIEGPWSPPIALGSRGFDFSFFHDTDAQTGERTHWIVGVQWDQRPEHSGFGGLVLEQYDPVSRTVSGRATTLLRADTLIEGPNLYRLGEWYYLLIAQGGTGWNHGVSLARSRSLHGPYTTDPTTSVLTSRDSPSARLQKAGHGELVQSADGQWLLVHLAARPVYVDEGRFCITGRETCLQRVRWSADGWLRLESGGAEPSDDIDLVDLDLPRGAAVRPPDRDDFDAPRLDDRRFSTLRVPVAADLRSRPGWLRLDGGGSTASVFAQSMIAQRIEENAVTAACRIDAEPRSIRQAAGLIAWYDRHQWLWAQITWDEEHGRHLRFVERDRGRTTRSPGHLLADGPVELGFVLVDGVLQFTVDGLPVGEAFDGWKLSDDYGDRLRFTGAFAGVRVEDLDSEGWHADIDWFSLGTNSHESSAG